ncbi:hypothetical protein [Aquimarina megaterium]|uniref:hypothetical protein n=1 Tax=Aquimarina megaterium TaxID=1443666 RepID=UPI0009451A85|nr:hypothetical protein [Aquimarina megaterium]
MDFIKSKLSSIGSLLFLMGLVSAILSIFNYNLKLLIWIDLWGTFMGWVIRILLIIGGAAIYLYTAKDELEN